MSTQKAVVSTKKVGFCGAQIETQQKDIIIDSGSSISLFKDKEYLKKLENAKQRLVMETNAGSKFIKHKGKIPGYGQVWYDDEAISNLFSISDMAKKGHILTIETDLDNAFIVKS